jgi:beta-lactamase regulating signal transducer with metallopeptidase domain
MSIAWPAWMTDAWAQLPMSLLHTLWLGAVAVLIAWAVLRRRSAQRPELRYGVCLAALGFVVAGWLAVWAGLVYFDAGSTPPSHELFAMGGPSASADPTDRSDSASVAGSEQVSTPGPNAPSVQDPAARHAALPWRTWLANAWLAGVAVMVARTILLVWGAGRLRRTSVLCDDDGIQAVLKELRETLGITGEVALRMSDRIDGPLVMGALWPMVLLPAYVMTGVPPEHLRAALAHELAHIRRYDYLVNLVQLLAESLLFFNPAVWWISRQIRIEREACCDALAIRCSGGATGYARALADFAARSLSPTTALAMGGPQPEHTLLDRIRRILTPHDRPALRLPWYSLIAFLVIGTALLAAFGGFSYLGVKLVAEAMTPQERIERIEAINRQFDETDPENVPEIAVSGTIRTEDGAPLPEGTRVTGMNLFPSVYIAHSCDIDGETFRCNRMKGSHIYIWAIADGYAPAMLGPYATENGADLTGIEIVLKRGLTGRIRVVDEDKTPVNDVDVMWQFPSDQGVTQGDKRTAATDVEGVAELAHTWDKPISLKLRKPGFVEFYESRFAVIPDEVVEIELQRMEPVTLELRDAVTGEPVPDAELRVNSTRDVGRNAIFDTKSTLAVSEETGTFTIETLRDGMEYWCYITAPGNRRMKLEEPIKVGQEPRTISLPPPLEVRGTVLVPPDESGEYPETVSLNADNPYEGGGYIESFGRNLEIPLDEGRGEFVVDDLWPGVVNIDVMGRREHLKVHETIDDYVIDLRPRAGAGTQQFRTVVLQVQVPEGDPEVNGSVRIHYLKQPGDNAYANAEVPIENGEARYEVPVPTEIGYDVLESPGYWVESESSIPVEPGDEPFVVELSTIPAGSIHGTVENAPEGQFGVSVVLVESPSGQDVFPLEVRSKRNERAYSLGPLPLGGTYIAYAHSKAAIALSEPLTLTDRAPIQEVKLTFAPGETVEGRVTYPDGSPANGLPIELSISTKYSHGFSTAIGVTGANGEFVVEHVDFDQPVTYAIILKPEKDFVEVRHEFSRGEPVEIQLERGLVLEGRVVEDATGNPVPGVEVYGTSTQPEVSIVDADARTDEAGRFRFTRLRNQVYSLGTRDGANPVRGIEAAASTNGPVEIRVEIQPWSSLRAVAAE